MGHNTALAASDSEAAREVLQRADSLLERLIAAEDLLDAGWAEFGTVLAEVRKNKYWEPRFDSFNSYLDDLRDRHKSRIRGRTQLYAYIGAAEKLLGAGVSADEMNQMGISKASLLVDSLRQSGKAPTAEIISDAINSEITVKDLRKKLFDSNMIGKEAPKEGMLWMDLGFYATKEHQATILEGLDAVAKVDPVVQCEGSLLNNPSAIRECMIRMAIEATTTWGAGKGDS